MARSLDPPATSPIRPGARELDLDPPGLPAFLPGSIRRIALASLLCASILLAILSGECPDLFLPAGPVPVELTAASVPATVPEEDVDLAIAFHAERASRAPRRGLDLAYLALAYIEKARRTGDDRWYRRAEDAAKRSLVNLPRFNHGARIALARVAEARHQFGEAIRQVQEVLEIRPGSAEALAIAIRSSLELGDLPAAGGASVTLVRVFPGPEAWALRARVLAEQGEDPEATRLLRRSIALGTADRPAAAVRSRVLLGRIYRRRELLQAAGALFESALGLDPDEPTALRGLASTRARQGRTETAARLLARAWRATGDPAPLLDLVEIRQAQGREPEAAALLDRAQACLDDPRHHGGFGHPRDCARLLLLRGGLDRARVALELLAGELTRRRDAETLERYAAALGAVGRTDDARRALREILDRGLRDPRLERVASAFGADPAARSE